MHVPTLHTWLPTYTKRLKYNNIRLNVGNVVKVKMNIVHRITRKTASELHSLFSPFLYTGMDAQQTIINLIEEDNPCMIARFGSVEIQAVINGQMPYPFSKILQKRTYTYLINNAGFFPVNRKYVKRFSRLMMEDMKLLDALGSWRIDENLFRHKLKHTKKIKLSEFAPNPNNIYYSYLKNKKVLVVSPFAELIEKQYYSHRAKIWPECKILPEYTSLETVTAVNSIGGRCNYPTWFDALDAMKKEIEKKDFDIALLGCGAYGFPLAAHIKRMGKKAIHVGGCLQLLFGIYGKRWEKSSYINDYWIRPRVQDRPIGFENVENGCYW